MKIIMLPTVGAIESLLNNPGLIETERKRFNKLLNRAIEGKYKITANNTTYSIIEQ